jgi:hypothetical protein
MVIATTNLAIIAAFCFGTLFGWLTLHLPNRRWLAFVPLAAAIACGVLASISTG